MIRIMTLAAGMLVIGGVSALASTLCRSRCCPTTATDKDSRQSRQATAESSRASSRSFRKPRAASSLRASKQSRNTPALTHEAACGRRLNGAWRVARMRSPLRNGGLPLTQEFLSQMLVTYSLLEERCRPASSLARSLLAGNKCP